MSASTAFPCCRCRHVTSFYHAQRKNLFPSEARDNQTKNYPNLLIPPLKKYFLNVVKINLGIMVYDRNVNFVKKCRFHQMLLVLAA